MFVGFDVIPQAAEEINLPYHQIGKLLIVSVVMAVFWYILVILASSWPWTPRRSRAPRLPRPTPPRRCSARPWPAS